MSKSEGQWADFRKHKIERADVQLPLDLVVSLGIPIRLAAANVAASHGIAPAFGVLFFGGMMVFPLATLACRYLFGRAKESGDNPLGLTALESTIAMVGGLFAAC